MLCHYSADTSWWGLVKQNVSTHMTQCTITPTTFQKAAKKIPNWKTRDSFHMATG